MPDDSNRHPIDWEQLGYELGSIHETGESGSSVMADQALEIIISPTVLRDSVDYYVAHRKGSELARSVLRRVHPWSAMQRCYEIYRNSDSRDDRISAIDLLVDVADERAVPWVEELLNDADESIQYFAAMMVKQLAYGFLIDLEEDESLLKKMADHPNPQVREILASIREYLLDTEE